MFDDNNGQIFKEWTVAREAISLQSRDDDWTRQASRIVAARKPSSGPLSLLEMAMRVLAKNVGQITEHHLDALPPRLVWCIWKLFEKERPCLNAWKLFSKILLKEPGGQVMGLYRFHQRILGPHGKLERYTQPLAALSADFISSLVIGGGCDFAMAELLCLADIKNLGVLDFVQPKEGTFLPPITDRLIRGWSEKDDPFPRLRSLRLYGNKHLTPMSLCWASKFPNLTLYEVTRARNNWPMAQDLAEKYSWRLVDTSTNASTLISRYLMLSAESEEKRQAWIQAVVKKGIVFTENQLQDIYSNSLQSIQCVNNAERYIPELVQFVISDDTGKTLFNYRLTKKRCNAEMDTSGATAFWLYSSMEALDRRRGHNSEEVEPETCSVVKNLTLPTKPMVCLCLGQSLIDESPATDESFNSRPPSYDDHEGCKMRRFTFIREHIRKATSSGDAEAERKRKVKTELPSTQRSGSLRSSKRQRLDNVLQTFSNQ